MLRVSERVNLAVHALGYMAVKAEGRTVAVAELADMLHVSVSHLAKVMQILVRGGFVRSIRGAHGGFVLTRDPETLTLLEIYEAVEGPVIQPRCLLGHPICKPGTCILQNLLDEMTVLIRNRLGNKTISDFVIDV